MNDAVGTYNLKHSNPLTTFGVLVYGQIQLEAYGYTGGSRYGLCKGKKVFSVQKCTAAVTCRYVRCRD